MKRILVFLVLGALFFVLVAFTSIMLWRASGAQPLLKGAIEHQSAHDWQAYYASGEYAFELSAFVLAIIATGVFIVWFVLLAIRSRISTSPITPFAALKHALQHDRDPRVRSKAAVGLTQLDLEETFDHQKHNKLDKILITTLLHDPDPRVRSKAAVGLAELELEQEKSSYHHVHDKLDDMLFEQDEYIGI